MRRAWLVGLLFWLLLFGISPAPAATPVWIDTDPSLGIFLHDADDIFALWTALDSKQLKVRGISIVQGNTSVAKGTEIAIDFLLINPTKSPVLCPGFVPPGHAASRITASLHAALKKERLTLIALGPLTNIAALLRRWPKDAQRIEKVICLGGELPETTLKVAGVPFYRFHDSNFLKDPTAFSEVLAAPLCVDLIPIDVAKNLTISPVQFELLGTGPSLENWLHRRAGGWYHTWRFVGAKAPPVFDVALVISAIDPKSLLYRPGLIRERKKPARLMVFPAKTEGRIRVAVALTQRAKDRWAEHLQISAGQGGQNSRCRNSTTKTRRHEEEN